MNPFPDADAAPEESMVCLSVVEDGPNIAFAAFDQETARLYITEARTDGYEIQDLVERVLAEVQPMLLLIPNRLLGNATLLEILTTPPANPIQGLDNAGSGEDEEEGGGIQEGQGKTNPQAQVQRHRSIPYRLMKTSSYDLRACKAQILKLSVRSLARRGGRGAAVVSTAGQPPRHFPLQTQHPVYSISNYHSLAALIDFDSTVQVQAVGALLAFLQTTVISLEEGGMIPMTDIQPLQVSMHMNIQPDALAALHIFATEHHPLAAAKGRGHAKEGFSLFSLLDRTRSAAGRRRLREWMLKPLIDCHAIAVRQDGVELFLLPDMQDAAGEILRLLKGIGATDQILARLQKCNTKPKDFVTLSKSLAEAMAILDTLQREVWWRLQQRFPSPPTQVAADGMPVEGGLLAQKDAAMQGGQEMEQPYKEFVAGILDRCDIDALQSLYERITSIIDEEMTLQTKAISILYGHDEELDAFKQQFERLEGESHDYGCYA
jgi:DNA mismatch repair ATPase MutS